MAHHAVENNPVKESLTALVGIALLLTIIGGIAVSGWLRPAGEHQPKTTQTDTATVASQTVDEAVAQTAVKAAVNSDDPTAAANVTAAAADTVDKSVVEEVSGNDVSKP